MMSESRFKYDDDEEDILPLTATRKHRSLSWSSEKPLEVLMLSSIWYIFAAMSTCSNKVLIKEYGISPQVLTSSHYFVGTLFDAFLLFTPSKSKCKIWHLQKVPMSLLLRILPLSLMAISAKVLTYWSYSRVPISLSHTAKASSPLFSVLLTKVLYGTQYSTKVYLSLLPIIAGVSMASKSEFNINDLAFSGVACAVSAALIGVVQNMYSKSLLRKCILKDSINLHFYGGVVGCLLNVPIICRELYMPTFDINIHTLSLMAICSFLQFFGSLTAYFILDKTSELTYSVLGTVKRVVIIFVSILYFGNPVTIYSASGMCFAMSGIAFYQYAKTKKGNQ